MGHPAWLVLGLGASPASARGNKTVGRKEKAFDSNKQLCSWEQPGSPHRARQARGDFAKVVGDFPSSEGGEMSKAQFYRLHCKGCLPW